MIRKNGPSAEIVIYANRAHTERALKNAVSGHAQIPLAICDRLRKQGHDVLFVTSQPRTADGFLGPVIATELLVDPTPRGLTGGLHLLGFPRHVIQLHSLIRRHRRAVVHFFGMRKVGLLLGALSLSFRGVKTVFTPVHYDGPYRFRVLARLERWLLGRIGAILPTSDYVAELLTGMGLRPEAVLRPGVMKDLEKEVAWLETHPKVKRRSVLFWRDATHQNGIDVAVDVFRHLAPAHPEIDFVFAVRHLDHWAQDMNLVAEEFENVTVHRFPYANGVTLIDLLRNAACALLPMRQLSVQPQFAILETMTAGVPVVTTRIESNPELIESGVTGFLFDLGDTAAAIAAIENLIVDAELGRRTSRAAVDRVRRRYNYDNTVRQLKDTYSRLLGYGIPSPGSRLAGPDPRNVE